MEEVGISESMLKTRYLEVWNKIDLVEGEQMEQEFQERIDLALESNEHPVVMMSCKQGFNKSLFLKEVEDMTADLMGKAPI